MGAFDNTATNNLIDGFTEWEALERHTCEAKTYLANHALDFVEDIVNILLEVMKQRLLCIGHMEKIEHQMLKNDEKSQNYLSLLSDKSLLSKKANSKFPKNENENENENESKREMPTEKISRPYFAH